MKMGRVSEFIELCRWMKLNSWRPVTKLSLAVFPHIGRGLMTLSNLKPQDLIVQIPLKLLITRHQVMQLIPQLTNLRLTTAESLTLFLIYCQKFNLNGKYIATLPSEFSVGALCTCEETEKLPDCIRKTIVTGREYLMSKFRKIQRIWTDLFDSDLPLYLFNWAWCSVNTRAVYYKDTNQLENNAENNMALAPYLDLLNHDPNAVVKAGFNEKTQCYEIRTLQPIGKHQQVFINYGPHDNVKLFLEYGFVVPGNIHAAVEFDSDYLLQFFQEKNAKKVQLISQQLQKNFFCNRDGFSWDAKIALAILSSDYAQMMKINHPYQINPTEINHEQLGYRVILGLLKSLEMAQQEDNSIDTTSSFSVAKMLLDDTVNVLKSALSATQIEWNAT